MAISWMAAGNEDTIGSLLECGEDVERRNAAGTHHLDGDDIGRVLHSGYAGQVTSCRGAPFAEKSDDFGFEFLRHIISLRDSRLIISYT